MSRIRKSIALAVLLPALAAADHAPNIRAAIDDFEQANRQIYAHKVQYEVAARGDYLTPLLIQYVDSVYRERPNYSVARMRDHLNRFIDRFHWQPPGILQSALAFSPSRIEH